MKKRKATSSSDTTEWDHPGHLSIQYPPGRKLPVLCIDKGSTSTVVARFVSEDATERFRNFIRAAEALELEVRWETGASDEIDLVSPREGA